MQKYKKYSLVLLFCSFLSLKSISAPFTLTKTSIPANGPCIAESCRDATYRLKMDSFVPTYLHIKTHDYIWHLQNGVQSVNDHEPVTVYSRGYRNGALLIGSFLFHNLNRAQSLPTVYKYIQVGNINTKQIVSFDYIDTIKSFDHGCTQRASSLKKIIQPLEQKNKNIILFGDSLGAKTILYLATQQSLSHVKAIVLESPVFDLKNMIKNEIQHDFWWLYDYQEKMYDVLCSLLPAYEPNADLTLDALKNIPYNIPIFIAHLHNDKLLDNETAKKIVNTLRDNGCSVYFLVIDHPHTQHSCIATSAPFIHGLNAFYKKYNLPHNQQFAHIGSDILARSHENTLKDAIIHIESVKAN